MVLAVLIDERPVTPVYVEGVGRCATFRGSQDSQPASNIGLLQPTPRPRE